jgi:hypothetical protein
MKTPGKGRSPGKEPPHENWANLQDSIEELNNSMTFVKSLCNDEQEKRKDSEQKEEVRVSSLLGVCLDEA